MNNIVSLRQCQQFFMLNYPVLQLPIEPQNFCWTSVTIELVAVSCR